MVSSLLYWRIDQGSYFLFIEIAQVWAECCDLVIWLFWQNSRPTSTSIPVWMSLWDSFHFHISPIPRVQSIWRASIPTPWLLFHYLHLCVNCDGTLLSSQNIGGSDSITSKAQWSDFVHHAFPVISGTKKRWRASDVLSLICLCGHTGWKPHLRVCHQS